MMKRWIALCLVLLLTLTLFTACKQQESDEATEPEQSDQTPSDTPTAVDGDTQNFPQPTYDEQLFAEPTEDLDALVKTREAYTVEGATADDADMQRVVAVCGDYALTNGQLQVYYWMQYHNFVNMLTNYGFDASMAATYMGLDLSQPLSEQDSMAEGLSWEQYFLEGGLTEFRQMAATATQSRIAGHSLSPEEQANLENLEADLEQNVARAGYESTLEFVQESFGPGVSVQDYLNYVRLYITAGSYYSYLYNSIEPSEEELAEYFQANEATYADQGISMDDDTALVNVRHILIIPDDLDGDDVVSDAEQAAARSEAERILDEYLENPTEENFAALAELYSTDPGSNTNGGLYEGVYPGQMVQTFNDWCFDASRQPGDTGIVETDCGFHVMYFSGRNDNPRWVEACLSDYRSEKMSAQRDEFTEQTAISVLIDGIVIAQADVYG